MERLDLQNDPGPSLVVKVGGSLFDLADLGSRLKSWFESLSTRNILVVPGGGPLVDALRTLTQRHGLDEDTAHWLAVQAMSINARFLSAVLGENAEVAPSMNEGAKSWQKGMIPVLDVHNFLKEDDKRSDALPHSWSVTSDSIACRVALASRARQLILLKSVTISDSMEWSIAAELGLVDPYFPKLAAQGLNIRAINWREWSAPAPQRPGDSGSTGKNRTQPL